MDPLFVDCPARPAQRRPGATLGDMQLRSDLLNAGMATRGAYPLQSSLMSKTYLKSDHFNGGGSPRRAPRLAGRAFYKVERCRRQL